VQRKRITFFIKARSGGAELFSAALLLLKKKSVISVTSAAAISVTSDVSQRGKGARPGFAPAGSGVRVVFITIASSVY